ncbi:hypothetical protein A2924_00440 [Candidatus Giovannonibacteria bacterium RIFCSPLOWO2_01_FULL_44_16]|uniref:Uncharacterized protein n=1 Tax=Candidatus Giovannonibacteria bacterium RIFCSPLOWO2_01_FULL_44_16 TaxID=1798348 RepID=A0A1F5X2M9_9BACT|nr:MAG: hypothetical protein A2924_00440 [Candidatus Giovannonibacteria bacterium RIFCSPLOWO2_01_FULL_44_16]
MFEKIQEYFGANEEEKSPEQKRIESLEARLADLAKERNRVINDNKSRPESWGVDPRLEQINQEAENIRREIDGKPPLVFHGSQR